MGEWSNISTEGEKAIWNANIVMVKTSRFRGILADYYFGSNVASLMLEED